MLSLSSESFFKFSYDFGFVYSIYKNPNLLIKFLKQFINGKERLKN